MEKVKNSIGGKTVVKSNSKLTVSNKIASNVKNLLTCNVKQPKGGRGNAKQSEIASNKSTVSNFAKLLTLFIVIGTMFLGDVSDVYSQNPPPKIARHLPDGRVVMDIPADVLKSFLMQTIINVDNNLPLPIDYVHIEASNDPNSADTSYLYLLAFGWQTTEGGRSIGVELEGNNDNVFPIASDADKTTHSCSGDPCRDCGIYRKGSGCRCKEQDGHCNHTSTTTSDLEIMLDPFGGFAWDYAAFYTMLDQYNYQNKSLNIATVMVNNPQFISSWNINTDCLKYYISKTVGCYVESIILCPDPTDTNYYILNFTARCDDSSMLNGEIRLKKINGDLYIDENSDIINIMNRTPITTAATLINSIDCSDQNGFIKSATVGEISGFSELISSFQINPNPVNNNTVLTLELAKSCDIKIVLTDILGQELLQIYDGFAEKTFVKSINTENLAKGKYFITVNSGNEKLTKSIIVE